MNNTMNRDEQLNEANGALEGLFRPLLRLSPRQRDITLLEVASSVKGEKAHGRQTRIAKQLKLSTSVVSQYAANAHSRLKGYFQATDKLVR